MSVRGRTVFTFGRASFLAVIALAVASLAPALAACGSNGASPGGAGDSGGPQPDAGPGPDGASSSDADAAVPNGESGAGDTGNVGDAGGWWKPGTATLPWQWEIDHALSTSSAADMGTGDTAPDDAAALAPVVYDIDGFDNPATTVSALHALGKKVVCYIEVGAAENYRSDYSQFPAADLGSTVPDYSDEQYVNINAAAVVTIMEARIAMCAQKGFDAIEPDIDDSYGDSTGFTITEADDVAYLTTLSTYAHGLGVAWGLKNGGDANQATAFVGSVISFADFAIVEEPFFLQTIGTFEPLFSSAGKAMFAAEYSDDTTDSTMVSSYCPQAATDHVNAALFSVNLDGTLRDPCQ